MSNGGQWLFEERAWPHQKQKLFSSSLNKHIFEWSLVLYVGFSQITQMCKFALQLTVR